MIRSYLAILLYRYIYHHLVRSPPSLPPSLPPYLVRPRHESQAVDVVKLLCDVLPEGVARTAGGRERGRGGGREGGRVGE